MKWESLVLKNGIQILTAKNSDLQTSCVGFYFGRSCYGDQQQKRTLAVLWANLFQNRLNQSLKNPLWKFETDWDYIAFYAECESGKIKSLIGDFVQCFQTAVWGSEELARGKKQLAAQLSASQHPDFLQVVHQNYWAGTSYAAPVCGTEEELAAISLKNLQKWQEAAGEAFLCVLTGALLPEEIKFAQSCLNGLEFVHTKSLKDKREKIPDGFGNRRNHGGWLVDTGEEKAAVTISFDIAHSQRLLPVSIFASFLSSGLNASLDAALQERLAGIEHLQCRLEKHRLASRLVISCSMRPENLLSDLHKCFAAIAFLKESTNRTQMMDIMQHWTESRKKSWMEPTVLNWNMGTYYCTAQEDCKNLIERKTSVSFEEIQQAAFEIFQPENMTVGILCPLGVVKRKKLQKVLLEGRILLAGPRPQEEDAGAIKKKLLRQFMRDCQAELDRFLAEESKDPASAYQIWKKFQCYVRFRKAEEPHYSFAGVQEFLLGHGYSKEDVKKFKKKKDREKKDENWKKQERPEDDFAQILKWFQEDTIKWISQLAQGPCWQGAEAACVKRCNLWMRYYGAEERGLDAVRKMSPGVDTTRIQAWLEQKEKKSKETV